MLPLTIEPHSSTTHGTTNISLENINTKKKTGNTKNADKCKDHKRVLTLFMAEKIRSDDSGLKNGLKNQELGKVRGCSTATSFIPMEEIDK